MAKYLILVDYQNDFVEGPLGTAHAQRIYPNIKQKLLERIAQGWQVIFTYDTHDENYSNTAEGKKLPIKHCIEGTKGWEIYGNLLEDVKTAYEQKNESVEPPEYTMPLTIKKSTFGYTEWKYLIPDADEIEIIGVCTEICVISNALILKAQFPEIPIRVDRKCCAGLQGHEAALQTMVACQIDVDW